MHLRNLSLLLAMAALLALPSVPSVAQAQDQAATTESPLRNRLEFNDATNTALIYLDGQPAVMITKKGMSVVNDVAVGGMVIDRGKEQIEEEIQKQIDSKSQ